MGALSLFSIYWVWFAERLTRTQLHHGQGCTWRYSATLHWRNYSAACVLFEQKKSPILLPCPASCFLKSGGCCSANNSCTAGSLGVIQAEERQDCHSSAPRRPVYKRCSLKPPEPGYLLPASGGASLDYASLCWLLVLVMFSYQTNFLLSFNKVIFI